MSNKAILVYVGTRPDSERRVRLAGDFARDNDAALIGLAAGFPRPAIYFDGFTVAPDMIEFERTQIEADLKSAASQFETITKGMGLRTEWRSSLQLPGSALVGASNAADLILIGAPDPHSPLDDYRSFSAGDLLMRAGRPVIVVPPNKLTLNIRRVLVAWKDIREARRAIADAVPFLKRAEKVFILEVRENSAETASISDAKAFLHRHSIEASAEVVALDEATVAKQLLHFTTQNEVDLLVAGAFGHSRLREWAFGGVTAELLAGFPIPCFLSH